MWICADWALAVLGGGGGLGDGGEVDVAAWCRL